jgi:hypothetical protein
VEFDRYTVSLLILRPDAPRLEEDAADALQDAHMSHLAAGAALTPKRCSGLPSRYRSAFGAAPFIKGPD